MARCNVYKNQDDWRSRCPAPATVRLYDPDDQPVPGGYYCSAHVEAMEREFHEKMGESWTHRPVDCCGREVPKGGAICAVCGLARSRADLNRHGECVKCVDNAEATA